MINNPLYRGRNMNQECSDTELADDNISLGLSTHLCHSKCCLSEYIPEGTYMNRILAHLGMSLLSHNRRFCSYIHLYQCSC
ncbi:hypothetical protein XELAEV_18026125mg [Xenopus laevis]|uniref:Uncharacterized protein n=1 Tax=Xenopus laevis TaxID=8355 RepID=A0A974CTB1_XENLA|nr:hypothetical protein XELAEV_18026125mg [Xenopus laevis]